jgi:hypothetical protein
MNIKHRIVNSKITKQITSRRVGVSKYYFSGYIVLNLDIELLREWPAY